MKGFGRWLAGAGIGLLALGSGAVSAQTGTRLAFVNGSGQLIVSSADGAYRWIVTNPGELLAQPAGYSWSPNGHDLFLAVNTGADVSLRVADADTQSVVEIGRASLNAVSGGEWTPDGTGVIVGTDSGITYVDAGSGQAVDLVSGSGLTVISPFADEHPNLESGAALSPDTRFVFYQQADGHYAVQSLDGAQSFGLPGANDANVPGSGLWSDAAPLVAYWGYEANSVLSVTDASTGATTTLDSGRAAPITPMGWRPRTTQLLYRDASGFIRAANVGCVSTGCPAEPLASGVEVLPATATDVLISADIAFYRDGETLYALPLSCIDSGACAGVSLALAGQAAPGTLFDVAGNLLVYTGYNANPNDASDREVRVIDLNCLSSGGCAPQALTSGAIAGLLSEDGQSVVVDHAGVGMGVYSFATGAFVPLSDPMGGAGLLTARWG